MSEPVTRPAAESDIDAITAVHRRAWIEGFRGIVSSDALPAEEDWRRQLSQVLAGDDPSILVTEPEGEIRGFVTYGSSRDDDADKQTAEVRAIYVDPAKWRSGVGSTLMDRAMRELRMRGFKQVTLWSFERNMRSRSSTRCWASDPMALRADGCASRKRERCATADMWCEQRPPPFVLIAVDAQSGCERLQTPD